jgi:hypothetical protein
MSSINESTGSSASGKGIADRASATLDAATQKVSEQARNAAQTATEQARNVAQSASETVKSAAADLTSEATKIAGDAADRAKSFADENKGKVAEQIDSLGNVLNKAADELESSNQAMFAGYARQLAGGVQSVSSTLRDKGVDELFSMVGDFARKQPAVFIGGAALLGFIASRFAVASAKTGQSAADQNWGTETDQSNWAPDRSGSPEVREPWSGDDAVQPAGASAWGDNADTNASGGSYGSTGSSVGGGSNGQWNSTRDSEGGTI